MENTFDIILLKIPLQHISFYDSQPTTTGQLDDCFSNIITTCIRFSHKDSLIAILIDPDEMPDDHKGMYNQILMNVLSRSRIAVWEEIIIPIIPNYYGGPLWNTLTELQPVHIRSFYKLYLCYRNEHSLELMTAKRQKKINRDTLLKAETYSTIWTLPCAIDAIRIDFVWDRIIELYKDLYCEKASILIPYCIDTPLAYIERLKKDCKIFVLDTGEHKQIAAKLNSNKFKSIREDDYSISWMPIIVPKNEDVIPKIKSVILTSNGSILTIQEEKIRTD